MRREGVKRMIFGGLLFFVVAPVVFVAALLIGVGGAINAISDSERLAPGESTYLDAGEKVSIFILTPEDISTDGSTPAVATTTPTCTATGPGGDAVDLRRTGGNSTVSENGDSWREGYTLTASDAGNYAITCGTRSTLIMDEDIATIVGRGMVFVVIALAAPFLIGVIGLGLFIWGLVRFNGSKPQANGGYPPYQGGGQYYPPTQPGQPPYGGQPGQNPYGT